MREMILSVTVIASLLAVGAVVAEEIAAEKWGEVDLRQQVDEVERAFAQTMADRDHEAFKSFLSDETVFFSGPLVLRGSAEVAARWQAFFEGPDAPFSWEPEMVEVLDSGTLALSTGPVRAPDGTLVSTFTSIWRQEEPGVWRIVFDKGNPVCPPQ